jgi:hypothetical protein
MRTLLSVFVLTAAVGCGGGPAPRADASPQEKGKLLKDGAPFVPDTKGLPPGDPGIRVTFIPAAGGADVPTVVNTTTGEFVIGAKGEGVKPGKYKVAVHAGPVGGKDALGDKFTKENTPIVRDVAPGQEVVIDLAKP